MCALDAPCSWWWRCSVLQLVRLWCDLCRPWRWCWCSCGCWRCCWWWCSVLQKISHALELVHVLHELFALNLHPVTFQNIPGCDLGSFWPHNVLYLISLSFFIGMMWKFSGYVQKTLSHTTTWNIINFLISRTFKIKDFKGLYLKLNWSCKIIINLLSRIKFISKQIYFWGLRAHH